MANLPSAPEQTPAPSLSSLINALYNLARAEARYIFGIGDWASVELWENQTLGWFDQMLRYLRYTAYWYGSQFYNVLQQWSVGFTNFVNDIKDAVNQLIVDWDNLTKPITEWWGKWKGRLDYLIQTVYGWLAWFFKDPYNALRYYLGAAWDWLRNLYLNPLKTIEGILAQPWSWVKAFYASPLSYIEGKLAGAWTWVKSLYADPYGRISLILGAVWLWAKSFYNAPFATVDYWTGGALSWLLDLFDIHPQTLLRFVADAMTYWYNLWSVYRVTLSAFLSDPAGYVLAALYDTFLDWFEQLIADNW